MKQKNKIKLNTYVLARIGIRKCDLSIRVHEKSLSLALSKSLMHQASCIFACMHLIFLSHF